MRSFARLRVDTIRLFDGDTALAAPRRLIATSVGFVALTGVAKLIGLDATGRVLWGRDLVKDGVTRVSDLKVGSADTVFVVDAPASRLVVLDGKGVLVESVSLARVGHLDAFAPLRGGTFMAVTTDSVNALVRFDRRGAIGSRAPFPWDGFRKLRPLARQGITATGANDSTWVFASAMGGLFVAFDGATARPFVGQFVEAIPFPDVIITTSGLDSREQLGRMTPAAAAVAVRSDEILVLFAGSDPTRANRVIDRFELRTGEYRSSYELPGAGRWICVRGKRLYALTKQAIIELVELPAHPPAGK